MGTLGIVGGIGPESTIEYYRFIVASYRERRGGAYPRVIINSIDLKQMLELCAEAKWPQLVDMLSAEIDKLADAGATFGALASNTPHIVFEELSERSAIPLISIVEAAARHANSRALKRLVLFGTRFTMEGGFYDRAFALHGMQVLLPSPIERDFIHAKYMNELLANRFLPETRDGMLAVVRRMQNEEAADALILGGTELPLILRGGESPVPLIDTTKVHVAEIVERLLAESEAKTA